LEVVARESEDFCGNVLISLIPSIMKWDIAEKGRVEWGNYRGIQFQHAIELADVKKRRSDQNETGSIRPYY
jgi:hypothetical protein